MDFLDNQLRVPWYKRWWGIIILFTLSLVSLFLLFFLYTTAKYIWLIKSGNSALIKDLVQPQGFSEDKKIKINESGNITRKGLESSASPYLGNVNAPLTVVAFMDFKCSNSRIAMPILSQIGQKYGSKVKIIFRHFPAESVRPGTTELSKFAFCSRSKGLFWSVASELFKEQGLLGDQLSSDDLERLSEHFGFDKDKIKDCLNSTAASQAVDADFIAGVDAGVRGTPTFFINGEKIEGIIPLDSWEKLIKTIP